MMKTALRTFAAIFVGLLLAFVLVVAVEAFSAVVHPFPENFGGTQEEMCQHVERYPDWVLAAVVPAWAVAALAGVWVAQKVGSAFSATVVGLLLLAAVVFNVSMLPYPIWFKAACLLAIPAAMILGIRRARPQAASQEKGVQP